jgi:hypothetical protein
MEDGKFEVPKLLNFAFIPIALSSIFFVAVEAKCVGELSAPGRPSGSMAP